MNEMTIKIEELRAWCSRGLDVLEYSGHKTKSVPDRLYYFMEPADIWELPDAKASVGDTKDDIQTLREEQTMLTEDLVDWHSLAHLVGILSAVASQTYPEPRPQVRNAGDV